LLFKTLFKKKNRIFIADFIISKNVYLNLKMNTKNSP